MRLEGLYAITPDWQDTPRLLRATAAILRGSCRMLQYRNKSAAAGLRSEQALALRRLCTEADCLFLVNDDPELALAVEADGVHLGADDGDLAAARRRLGNRRILGASCYRSLDLARAAVAAGADYVAFGSFFPSPSKPHAPRAEPSILAAARAELPVSVAAIGGITAESGAALVAAGARMLAVISALYEAPDPAAAAQAFSPLFADISERTPAP
ncbi:MAG TPA: thiamine phosphate synthase [Thiobacillaceae bacterium]|nr:thiamine phosphate synthase [Thiobacillaceae bacterium]